MNYHKIFQAKKKIRHIQHRISHNVILVQVIKIITTENSLSNNKKV